MSLPLAKKEVSDHPSAMSVVDPIDKNTMHADVDRKLRFYGAIAAFRESRMPSNEQLDRFIGHVSDATLSNSNNLSPEGQKLVQDSHEIFEVLRELIQEKNADELLQNFVWHTRDVNYDQAKKDPNEILPDNAKAKSDGQQAVAHLRTLLTLVFTNAEVRKLMADFGVIGRDLLARGAEKVAATARPDQERFNQIDDPAPEHKFVSEGGKHVGPNETPVRPISLSTGRIH